MSCGQKHDIDSDDDMEAQNSARPELDGLLFDSEHDPTDVEADALSLHSNFGMSNGSASNKGRKKRRRKAGKYVRIFGYDLFGRPRMPDPSPPASEDESSALDPQSQNNRLRRSTPTPLDPDAAPLEDAAIATLSSSHVGTGLGKWDAPLTDEQIALEEALQQEKEERKARRAARRLRKLQRAEDDAAAAADHAAGFDLSSPDDVPEFEGFPGGNATLARDAVPPTFDNDGEYGPWMGGSQSRTESMGTETYDSEDDEIDVGGEYNRKSRASGHSGSGGESSSKRSRSRRSHTSSIIDGSLYAVRPRRNYHSRHDSLLSPHNVPLPPSSVGSAHGYEAPSHLPQLHPKKRPAGYSRSSAARSHASSSTSQSTPIRSPLGQEFFPQQAAGVGVESPFGEEPDSPASGTEPQIGHPTAATGFPSTGFGGGGGQKRSQFLDASGAAFARAGW